ncbi:hypothetical protein SADUNF_Sadunf06G0106700 [Salix dunnii]|uniref:Uncharacterized protein n=1 Tax=Salix dunnii TaxID=1413687 RepID=A0A835K1U2_9ROSI|nr:hypothetical protein SADUNF_Sadunf06G0106700 [Salix dunnii]
MNGGSDAEDSEVYGIDYRGPETHSSVMPPPAGHSHDRPWIHQDTVKTSHKPQGFRGDDRGEKDFEVPRCYAIRFLLATQRSLVWILSFSFGSLRRHDGIRSTVESYSAKP